MRIAVAVSGGVDSLCALLLLHREGHQVLALHALLAHAPTALDTPIPGLESICRSLGVPLEVANLRDQFARDVIKPFATAYAAGLTPNPCALCNQKIKFGALMDAALELGAEALATGHYARLVPGTSKGAPGPLISRAAHSAKDQSYFLSLVPQNRLARVRFPLAELNKATCAALVAEAGLKTPVPAESHDICFAPGGVDAYRDFLAKQWDKLKIKPSGPGPILLSKALSPEDVGAPGQQGAQTRQEEWNDASSGMACIGVHAGLWRYTEGQRRGLNVSHAEALHVLNKDVSRNALVVGPRSRLGMSGCVAGNVNLFAPPELWPKRILARCRYGGSLAPANVRLENHHEEQKLHLQFSESIFPTAPGQVVAIYDEDGIIIAGGIVEEILS